MPELNIRDAEYCIDCLKFPMREAPSYQPIEFIKTKVCWRHYLTCCAILKRPAELRAESHGKSEWIKTLEYENKELKTKLGK